MRLGKRHLPVCFLALSLMSPPLGAAELQPLPPVAVPRLGVMPPETTLPPAVSLPGTTPPGTSFVPPSNIPMAPSAPSLGAPSVPPVMTPEAFPPGSFAPPEATPAPPPVALPPGPSLAAPSPAMGVPPSETALMTEPFPTTAAPETIPQVSQPLRPVSPETVAETAKKVEEEGIYFNVADEDIKEVIKQISRALSKNFIIDDKLRGKVTIISERKMTKDEIWEAFQSALDVNGFTIVQGPAGLLRLVSTREAISHPIDLYTGDSPFSDRFITRLITLKNISASDMANVIKGLVSKEGNLFAYPVTNTLILTDKGTNIDRLLKLINELDREGPQEVIEIIPILYADVKDLAAKVTQIFETEKAGAGAAAHPPRKGKEAETTLEEMPRLRKVIPDERTNSLIVLASKIAIKKVRDLIKKLDSPLVGEEGEVHVYYLKYANAKDMATVLNAISGTVQQTKEKEGKKGGATVDTARAVTPAAVSHLVGGAEFTGKFNVSADETTNALIITASSKDYNTLVEQVIAKLDIPRRQVYVEAVIVELIADMDRDLGTGSFGGKTINIKGNEVALFGNTFGFLNPGILAGSTSSFGGATTGDPFSVTPPGGTSIDLPRFFSAFQLQQSNVETNILSTPNILTMDNEEAEIKVGEKVPFKQNAAAVAGTLQASYTREDVALSLKIKPQISESDTVKLTVEQVDENVKLGTEASEGGPTTTKRSIKTAIVTNNGQTVVLGGLIRDFHSDSVRKIPLLGDIPILGYLFKTKVKHKRKSNLVVFLTPHVIRQPRDFLSILQKKINEQNQFIADNFGKGQQKQIRKSLEAHASHLLREAEGGGMLTTEPVSPELTEEDKFPMELAPTPPQGGVDEDLAVEPRRKRGRRKKPEASATEQPPPPAEPAPASPPASGAPTDEDIDLAY